MSGSGSLGGCQEGPVDFGFEPCNSPSTCGSGRDLGHLPAARTSDMARDRVRNVPVSSLADPIRDQFNSRVGSRRYVLSLVTRILLLEVKQSLQHFLEDVYQTAIEHVQEKLQPDAARRATFLGFQQFAASLGSRCVLHGPPLGEAEQGLPAA